MRLRCACYPVRVNVMNGALPSQLSALYGEKASVIVAYRCDVGVPPGWSSRRIGAAIVAVRAGNLTEAPAPDRSGNVSLPRHALVPIGMLVVVALGLGIVRTAGLRPSHWTTELAVAHVIGSVALSAVLTAGVALTNTLAVWPIYAAAAAIWWMSRGRRPADTAQRCRAGDSLADIRLLIPAARVVIALGIAAMLVTAFSTRLSWDGWSTWAFKARAFVHDGDFRVLADPVYDFSHRDYPLLVPLHTWWLQSHLGTAADTMAQLGGLLFALDLLMLVYGVGRALGGRTAGLAASALVAAQPTIMRHASSGYADVPFAACLLAAVWMTVFVAGEQRGVGMWVLAGMAGASLVLTKNEGWPALVALAVIIVAISLHEERKTPSRALCSVFLWAVTAFLCVLPWMHLRVSMGLKSDLVGGGRYPVAEAVRSMHQSPPDAASPIERVRTVVSAVWRCLWALGPDYPAWGLAWILAAAGLAATRRCRDARLVVVWVLIGAQLGAYMLALVRTPHPLAWHLSTSLDRLLMHVLPAALTAACGAIMGTTQSQPGRMVNEQRFESETVR
jgi:hypothetical protein